MTLSALSDAVSALALVLPPGVPLVLALALMYHRASGIARFLAPWAALPALALAVLPIAPENLHIAWLLLGTDIGIDGVARVFLLFSALVWLAGGIFSLGYFADEPARRKFFVFYLLTMSGNLGLIVAQDMLGFYVFFALMSFAAYGLVVHKRSAEALRAGRNYMVLVALGEVLLFVGMLLAAQSAGALDFDTVRPAVARSADADLIILLILLGFGIKAGAIGVHVSLPLIYPAAPTPASAVLAGAMINAGLLGWLRLLPLGHSGLSQWGGVVMGAGLAAAFYGALVGLTQRDPKAVLGYSSISQMGLITVGVGLGFAVPEAWAATLGAVLVYALHHGLAKGALFLGVGVASIGATSNLKRGAMGFGLLLPSLALAGAPLTTGMLAKALLKAQITLAPAPWDGWLKTLLPWSAVFTTLMMVRFLQLAWPRRDVMSEREISAPLLASWAGLLGALVVAAWLIPSGGVRDLWSRHALADSLWPIVLGTVVAVGWGWMFRRRASPVVLGLPPGDILIPVAAGLKYARSAFGTGVRILEVHVASVQAWCEGALKQPLLGAVLRGCELRLTRWPLAATLFVFTGLAAALISLL